MERWLKGLVEIAICVVPNIVLLWYLFVLRPRRQFRLTEDGFESRLEECPGTVRWGDVWSVTLARVGGDYDLHLHLRDRRHFCIDGGNERPLRSRLLAAMSRHLPGFSPEAARAAIKAREESWMWERPPAKDATALETTSFVKPKPALRTDVSASDAPAPDPNGLSRRSAR